VAVGALVAFFVIRRRRQMSTTSQSWKDLGEVTIKERYLFRFEVLISSQVGGWQFWRCIQRFSLKLRW
jgi:hypothetical protein